MASQWTDFQPLPNTKLLAHITPTNLLPNPEKINPDHSNMLKNNAFLLDNNDGCFSKALTDITRWKKVHDQGDNIW